MSGNAYIQVKRPEGSATGFTFNSVGVEVYAPSSHPSVSADVVSNQTVHVYGGSISTDLTVLSHEVLGNMVFSTSMRVDRQHHAEMYITSNIAQINVIAPEVSWLQELVESNVEARFTVASVPQMYWS